MVTTDAFHVERSPRLDSLQGLRAIAALSVVLFHLHVYTIPVVLGAGPLWAGFSMGYAGVEIFFVLSGFIMVLVHRKDFDRPERVGAFLHKRIMRIYPFLWFVLLVTVAARILLNGLVALPTLSSFVNAIFLWPDYSSPVLEVTWTLSFEMLFYLVFSLTILNLRLGLLAGAIWFILIAGAAIFAYEGPGASFLFSPYNLLFLFGIVAALSYRRIGLVPASAALVLGSALFLLVGLAEVVGEQEFNLPLRTVLYGIGGAGIVTGLAALNAHGRISAPRLLVFLGDASYSIYLVHIMAMTLFAKIIDAAGLGRLAVEWSALVLFAGAILAGVVAHVVLERPMLNYLRRYRAPAVTTGNAAPR